jgi:hypothetical protein
MATHKRPGSSNILRAMNTPSAQILISNYQFPLTKWRLFEEITVSGSKAGQTHVSMQERKCLKMNRVMSKGHRILFEMVPTG